MRIYDISQEVFACAVYPGDPKPQKEVLQSMGSGSLYNLTAFSMCAHNGTHVDAPLHFFENGDAVDAVRLEACIGAAFVASCQGELDAALATDLLKRARLASSASAQRILLKGNAVVSQAAAEVFAEAGILLLGVESQSVGPEEAPMAVHRTLLGRGVVLLEGLRLEAVEDGVYCLHAAPLKLGGCEGAPCRAVLLSDGC